MFLSLLVGVLGSIEMFFQVQKQMEIELIGSKEFYILSCDVYKWLSLSPENRITTPREFLNESYTRYIKLIETSITLKKRVEDKLMEINPTTPPTTPSIPQSASTDLFVDTSSDDSNA